MVLKRPRKIRTETWLVNITFNPCTFQYMPDERYDDDGGMRMPKKKKLSTLNYVYFSGGRIECLGQDSRDECPVCKLSILSRRPMKKPENQML